MAILTRLQHAWNAFKNELVDTRMRSFGEGVSYGTRPDRVRRWFNERTIISSIVTHVSMDAAGVGIRHVRLDDDNRYLEDVDSGLNNCLTLECNIDQAAQAFRQDLFATILEKGVAAIVPVDTSISPMTSGGFDIKTLRVGEIVAWMPHHVRVSVYDESEDAGIRKIITLEKKFVAIVENPLYSVMNEVNSTFQRLIRKLSLLDTIDEQSGSGKLDIIIQLPYVIKSEARRKAAEQRRADIEFQLKGSQYGIAYTDGTEKITQLNRPAENNLLSQVEYLINMLYGELGLTPEIMNGTADEKTMLNYMNRTIGPLVVAVVEAMRRTFLTKTARSQRQTIMYFRNPFMLVPIGGEGGIADIFDKLARNEILTSNEMRQILGIRPSKDPKADKLINSNMPVATPVPPEPNPQKQIAKEGNSQNGSS